MLTLYIRIADSPAGQDYPISLLLDSGQAGWEAAPIAQGTIPRDLAVAGAPDHPDQPGTPLTAATALAWYQKQLQPSPGFESVGELLYRLLDQPGISAKWKEQREAGWAKRATGESLRTILEIAPSTLSDLPWELIYSKPRFFFTEGHGPWYRGASRLAPAAPISRPVKLMVVVGCNPKDDKTIQWRAEVQAILDVTCPLRTLFDVEVLEQPTIEQLTKDLGDFKPDVLHFIGHGVAGNSETTAGLMLWSGGVTRTWTAREIFQLLNQAPPRLVFVNACRTAAFAGTDGSWRVASALHAAEVPAVIGMQGDVHGEPAVLLSRRIYEQLAAGTPIDAAVAQARLETMQADFGQDRRDWSLLTLTLACAPADVLALEAPPPDELANLAKASDSILSLSGFVGRRRDRREVKKAAGTKSNLVVLVGGEGIGKSDFLKTCLEQFALRGNRVVYVDLATPGSHDAIGLLRLIRGPKEIVAKDLLRPNLYASFADFNEELNALLEGKPAPATLLHTEASTTDAGKPYRADAAHPDTLKRAFESFGRGLVAAANGEPLYIVIDHLAGPDGGMPPEQFTNPVKPLLVDVIARRELGPVRLVLALRDDQVGRYGLSAVVQGDAGKALLPFARGDWPWLASEYLLLRKLDRVHAMQMLEEFAGDITDDGFSPEDLDLFAKLVKRRAKKAGGG